MVFEASLHGAAASASRVVTVARRPQPQPTEATDQQVTSEGSQSKLTTISSGIEVVGLLAKCIILGLAWPRGRKGPYTKPGPYSMHMMVSICLIGTLSLSLLSDSKASLAI